MTKAGEQNVLIDTAPENAKEIIAKAKEYKEAQTERLGWLAKEKKLKDEIREMMKTSGLVRLENGNLHFVYDGMIVDLVPEDDKIKVTEAKTPKG